MLGFDKLKDVFNSLTGRDGEPTRMHTSTFKIGRVRIYGEFSNKYQYTITRKPLQHTAKRNKFGTWDITETVRHRHNHPFEKIVTQKFNAMTYDAAKILMLREEMRGAAIAGNIRNYAQFRDYVMNFSGSSKHICSIMQKDPEFLDKTLEYLMERDEKQRKNRERKNNGPRR